MTLQLIVCEPCANDREAWCRVWTVRDDRESVSELSWHLARRIVPKLLARYGRPTPPGLFHGAPILIRKENDR